MSDLNDTPEVQALKTLLAKLWGVPVESLHVIPLSQGPTTGPDPVGDVADVADPSVCEPAEGGFCPACGCCLCCGSLPASGGPSGSHGGRPNWGPNSLGGPSSGTGPDSWEWN